MIAVRQSSASMSEPLSSQNATLKSRYASAGVTPSAHLWHRAPPVIPSACHPERRLSSRACRGISVPEHGM